MKYLFLLRMYSTKVKIGVEVCDIFSTLIKEQWFRHLKVNICILFPRQYCTVSHLGSPVIILKFILKKTWQNLSKHFATKHFIASTKDITSG